MTTTTTGWFTLDQSWLNGDLPGAELTIAQTADLLRLCLDGTPHPQWTDPRELLSRLHLAAQNEARKQQRRAEHAEHVSETTRRQAAAAGRVLFAAGKRLTIRTADLRAALDEGAA